MTLKSHTLIAFVAFLARVQFVELRFASGFVEGMQHMINKGAKLNIVDERGRTPLHHVVAEGQSLEMVSCLLKNGADLEISDNEGLTPFELAKKH